MRTLIFCLLIALIACANAFTLSRSPRLVSKLHGTYEDISSYGRDCFKGAVAAPYLKKAGLEADAITKADWTTNGDQDKMAAAILEWAKHKGATSVCHWFQPMASAGVRFGQTGQVYNKMLKFDKDGKAVFKFDGDQLLQGETDGSSFPNGGLRATHRAGAYLTPDPTSPVFIRDDVVYIPSCMVAYTGLALDEKLPLLRAADSLSKEGARLMNNLGYKVDTVFANIGLEQELFFVPRKTYLNRPDLLLAGRTVMGKMPARGQEMCDHYMAPLGHDSAFLLCMQEIQEKCFAVGIPLATRHKEVAPGQYEFAPLFGTMTTQIDQNLIVMQIIEETAIKHELAALFQEKPFQGVNGSGKHNNWSIATEDGTNLLNPKQVEAKTGNPDIFPIIMAAIIKAIDENGDLMRMAVSTPGNDFRLGACEAPPAIMSMYLGEELSSFMQDFCVNDNAKMTISNKEVSLGSSKLAKVKIPPQDRNRSSPMPYGGNRFEFRAVGSSQNVSIVNIVLAAIVSKAFKDFSDAIEAGQTPKEVAQAAIKGHSKVVFDGNGYDLQNQEMLTKAGLWRIDSGVDAMAVITSPKNVALFEQLGIFSEAECESRKNVMLDHYTGMVEIEAQVMMDMIQQQVSPIVPNDHELSLALKSSVETLKTWQHKIHDAETPFEKASLSRELRLEVMEEARKVCDAVEAITPKTIWPMPTYSQLLFDSEDLMQPIRF
jgi:glutamine synthetase